MFHRVSQASRRKLILSVIISKPWMQMQFGIYIFYWDCLVVFLSFVIFISLEERIEQVYSLSIWVIREVACLSYRLSTDVKGRLCFILKNMFYNSTLYDFIF